MKILVTGGSGFIARHLLPVLATRYVTETDALVAVSRHGAAGLAPHARWVAADLGKSGWTASLPDEPVDAVVHLAQSRHYREFPSRALEIFNVNVKSTFELADWAVKHGAKRFVFASTGNVYGFGSGVHREDDPCAPDGMYAASKLSAELLLKPFAPLMSVLVLRLFGVYGPGQTDAMLPGIIQRFLAGEEIVLAGNVGVEFNPIYVDDCSMAVSELLASPIQPGYQILNLGGVETVDLRRVADLLEHLEGRKARIRVTSEPPTRLVGSIDKLRRVIPFHPATTFAEGLSRTLTARAVS